MNGTWSIAGPVMAFVWIGPVAAGDLPVVPGFTVEVYAGERKVGRLTIRAALLAAVCAVSCCSRSSAGGRLRGGAVF